MKNKIINYIADKGKLTIYAIQIVSIILFVFYKCTELGNRTLSLLFNSFLRDFLMLNAGNLISLSAIFLGIYFTLFTLISTLDINSWITNLPNKRFKEIINLIKNGFSITFIYVLYLLLVNSIIPDDANTFYIPNFLHELIFLLNFMFCLYILLIALVIATIIYTAYQKDISEFNNKKEQKINDDKEIKLFVSQAKKFFDSTDNTLTRLEKKITEKEKN